MNKTSKILSIMGVGLWVALLAMTIIFGCVSTKRGKTIKTKEIRIEQLMAQRDSLTNTIQRLGAEDVLTVNVSFNLKQTNVLSFSNNNCQQIAKEVATLTRLEMINYKDSIANTKEDNTQCVDAEDTVTKEKIR